MIYLSRKDTNICRLKQFRLAKGLTQEQLANAVGVRRETIMRLEKAQYTPPEAGR